MKENPIPVKYSGNNLREVPLTSVKVNSFLQEFLIASTVVYRGISASRNIPLIPVCGRE